MTMHGSLSIEKNHARWSKAHTDGYLSIVAIGILAGIVTAYARTPIHLPGHKTLLWMTPILAGRLAIRVRAGAAVGVLVAALTTLLLGGRLAGGIAGLPLVILAGVVLDLAVATTERRNLPFWRRLPLLALAGLVGNLFCSVQRLLDSNGAFLSARNIQDSLTVARSYTIFGLLAGMLGAAAGSGILTLRRHKATHRASAPRN